MSAAESYSLPQVPKSDLLRSSSKAVRGRKPKKPLLPESEETIRILYFAKKLSIRAVAKATEHSPWQVRQVIGKGRSHSEANRIGVTIDLKVRADILRLRRAGNTYEEIAESVNRSITSVTRIVTENLEGVVRDRVNKQITRRMSAKNTRWDAGLLIRLSDEGFTKRQIAAKVGCGIETVARARRNARWDHRKNKK